jgi:hypothetical protein
MSIAANNTDLLSLDEARSSSALTTEAYDIHLDGTWPAAGGRLARCNVGVGRWRLFLLSVFARGS